MYVYIYGGFLKWWYPKSSIYRYRFSIIQRAWGIPTSTDEDQHWSLGSIPLSTGVADRQLHYPF